MGKAKGTSPLLSMRKSLPIFNVSVYTVKHISSSNRHKQLLLQRSRSSPLAKVNNMPKGSQSATLIHILIHSAPYPRTGQCEMLTATDHLPIKVVREIMPHTRATMRTAQGVVIEVIVVAATTIAVQATTEEAISNRWAEASRALQRLVFRAWEGYKHMVAFRTEAA